MFAIGVAAFALGFSIVAIVVSAGAVYYSASQARSYKKIEANDSERRAEELANRKVADVHWVASFRRSADTNEFGFDDTVNLVVTNKGPHDADDVAFEVPTAGLRYDMTRTGFGVIHAGKAARSRCGWTRLPSPEWVR
jgi:hypothetical protein